MPNMDGARKCWIAAAVLGVLIWLMTAGFGDLRWFEGLFLGLVAVWLFGSFLIWAGVRGHAPMDAGHWQPEPPAKAPEPVRVEIAPPAPAVPDQIAATPPDDLKLIKGVGPKLEDLLHSNGVTSFAQIAAWDDAAVDHHAALIGRMGGRIRSDDWVGQARDLGGAA